MLFNKSIMTSFAGLSLINILNIIVPIITMPYLSRVLTPTGYGVFLLFSTVYIFAFIIIDYSINITGVREIAEAQSDEEENIIFRSLQSLRLLLSLIACFLSIVYIYYVDDQHLSLGYIFLNICTAIFGYYLSATWYHQGKQEMTILALSSLCSRIVQLLVIFCFVKEIKDINLALLANSLVFLIPGMVAAFYRKIKNNIGISFSFSYKSVKVDLKRGFNAFIGDFAPNLYSNLPPLLIGLLATPAVFATYSLSLRIINIAGSFQLMMAKAIFPSVVKGEFTFKSMMIMNIIIGLIPVLLIIFLGNKIVYFLLGEGYAAVAEYLFYLAPTILFASILFALTYGYFLPNKLDKEFRNLSLAVSVISAFVGYIMIYRIGVMGAILMFVLARFLFMLSFMLYYLKVSTKHSK